MYKVELNTALAIIFLVFGLLFLWKTGGWAVHHAIRFSLVYRVESFYIGFFIFAIATTLPEITSAIVSSLQGVPALSAGDLMGSSLVNLSLLLGIASIVAKELPVDMRLKNKLLGMMIAMMVMMVLIVYTPLHRLSGWGLVAVYILSIFWLQSGGKQDFSEKVTQKTPPVYLWVSSIKIDVLLKLTISLVLLILSAWITVIAAMHIAKSFHISIAVIGATVIAIGTSLPELTLQIHAIRKREYALALGDIFGASLVNLSFILGFLLVFNPPFDLSIGTSVFYFLIPTSLVIFFRLLTKKPFKTVDGALLIAIFVLYLFHFSHNL